MTILTQIMEYMHRVLDFTSDTSDLRSRFPDMNRGSMSSALSRAVKKGSLERISRGVYKIKQMYRMFRHTKRIKETSTKKPQREFDVDVETTSEGLVPSWIKITDIEGVLNPKLIDSTLVELGHHGFFIYEQHTTWEIMGSEWLDETKTRFDPHHVVEIIVINNSGTRYIYKTGYRTKVNEFE